MNDTTTGIKRNPLPGVPKIESPFFNRFFSPDDPIYETAKSLNEKGYAIIDFPDPDMDALAADIIADLTPRYNWESWKKGQAGGPRLAHAYKYNESALKIATNPAILDLLTNLYGRQAKPFQTLNFPVGTQQDYHSDSVHFSSLPERFMCGVWVALEDINADNGPLMYFPETHKYPVYLNEHIGKDRDPVTDKYGTYNHYISVWQELVAELGLEPEYAHIKKGQALIWCANLLHGGAAQKNIELTRHSQVTHYFFEGCSYYVPVNSNIVLGEMYYCKFNDIATGEPIVNMCNDKPVPQEHIDAFDITYKDIEAGKTA